MSFTQELMLDIVRAVGLGLGAALLLWMFRRYSIGRRIRITVVLKVITPGVYLISRDSGLVYEEIFSRLAVAATVLIVVHLGTQLIDLLVWAGFLAHRRNVPVRRSTNGTDQTSSRVFWYETVKRMTYGSRHPSREAFCGYFLIHTWHDLSHMQNMTLYLLRF